MKGYPAKIIFLVCMCLICPLSTSAEVDWQAQRTINLNKNPVDLVMSAGGKYMYVLTDGGVIYVYDSAGSFKGQIEVGKDIDKITAGSDDNLLILTSKKSKKIRTISVDFIQQINIAGSPFKGNADAPVVIVVFTDYQ